MQKKNSTEEGSNKKNIKNIIKEFAKNLYLEFNADGNKKYSLNDIQLKINEKFNIKYTRQSIFQWAKKGCWDELEEKYKNKSIILSNIPESQIESIASKIKINEKSEYYSIWKNMFKGFSREIFKRIQNDELSEISTRDIIFGMEKSFLAIANFLGLEERTILHKTIDKNGNVTGIDFSGMSEDELKRLAGD